MRGFFRTIFCCSSNGVSSPAAVSSSANPSHNPNRNRNSNTNRAQQQTFTVVHERRRQSNNVKPPKKFLKLKSMFPTENIHCSDIRSDEMKDLRYNCPICFRYFNHILISSCCQNYMCHFCANDLNDRVKKDDKVIVARCPFCENEDFELHDVDPKEKPKKYTDSFYSTVKSNGKGAIFGNEQFQFNSTKNKGQMYASHIPKKKELDAAEALKDQRAASDGAVYLQKEGNEKLSNTYNFQNHEGFDEYGSPLRANLTHIIMGAQFDNSHNTHDEVIRRSFVTNEEQKSNVEDEDDDLNDRDLEAPVENIASPNRIAGHYGDIEVIREDEFECSMAPPQMYENVVN